MENELTIESARQFLKDKGFYTDNLWHIDDVQQNYDVSDDEAYDILNEAMQSNYIIENIFGQIDYTIKNK